MRKTEANDLTSATLNTQRSKKDDEIWRTENPDLSEYSSDYVDILSNESKMLHWCVKENQLLFKKGLRAYTAVPLYQAKAKYITIDTNILFTLLGGAKQVGMPLTIFASQQLEQWNTYFDLPSPLLAKAINRKSFNFMIKTDGCGVSVVTCKWKLVDQELASCTTKAEFASVYKARREAQELIAMTNMRKVAKKADCGWIGIDPGRRDVMAVTKRKGDGGLPEKHLHFSNRRYYTESRFRLQTRRMANILEEDDLDIWNRGIPSAKFGGVVQQRHVLQYVLGRTMEDMLRVVCSMPVKKQRWKTHIENSRTVDRFCREILNNMDRRKTVVCFGDASYRHNSAGSPSSPRQKRFMDRLRYQHGVHVLVTSEYNSSQVCSACNAPVKLRAGGPGAVENHFVRSCTENNCRTIWNRDRNASRNMIAIGQALILKGTKPEVFSVRKLPTWREKEKSISAVDPLDRSSMTQSG
jgi:hypothetical protein